MLLGVILRVLFSLLMRDDTEVLGSMSEVDDEDGTRMG